MNRSFTKEAIIGPMAEATTFGLPSVIGYQFGKAEGRDLAKDRRASPKVLPHKNRPQRKKQVAAIALVPGSTGYLVGKKVGYKEELLESMAKWQEELKFHKVRKQSTKKYRNRVKFLMSNIKRNQQLLTKMVKDQKKQGIPPPHLAAVLASACSCFCAR